MTSKGKHRKHAKLTRPEKGQWARLDLGIFGNKCASIAALSNQIAQALDHLAVKYVDADHSYFDNPETINRQGALFYSEHLQQSAQFTTSFSPEGDLSSPALSYEDLAIVNANHFEVDRTVLYYHPSKDKSILKRKHQLEHTKWVYLEAGLVLPEEIKSALPVDVETITELEVLIQQVNDFISTPVLKGLVLAGGQSVRMGQDKTLLNHHGLPQREHLLNLISEHTSESFLSLRNTEGMENELVDRFQGLGPFGAILSAFQSDPNAAWLVVATDLPNIDQTVISKLIAERSTRHYATCFHNEVTDFPDPLCTIWEPKAYHRLLTYLAGGYSCPRKVLINSPVKEILPDDPAWLFNLNTPEDLAKFKQRAIKDAD